MNLMKSDSIKYSFEREREREREREKREVLLIHSNVHLSFFFHFIEIHQNRSSFVVLSRSVTLKKGSKRDQEGNGNVENWLLIIATHNAKRCLCIFHSSFLSILHLFLLQLFISIICISNRFMIQFQQRHKKYLENTLPDEQCSLFLGLFSSFSSSFISHQD